MKLDKNFPIMPIYWARHDGPHTKVTASQYVSIGWKGLEGEMLSYELSPLVTSIHPYCTSDPCRVKALIKEAKESHERQES